MKKWIVPSWARNGISLQISEIKLIFQEIHMGLIHQKFRKSWWRKVHQKMAKIFSQKLKP